MNNKRVHFIRHGQALHNVGFDHDGEAAYTNPLYTDSSLTPSGIQQALALTSSFRTSDAYLSGNYTIVVSPHTRCIMTALIVLDGLVPDKIIALDSVREFPCGKHTPNKRHSRSSLDFFYGEFIDFDHLESEKDERWTPDREETKNELIERLEETKRFFSTKIKTDHIVVFSHCSFMAQYLFDDLTTPIEHCTMYSSSLSS